MNNLYLVVIDSDDTEQYKEILNMLFNNGFHIKETLKLGFREVTIIRVDMKWKWFHVSHHTRDNLEQFRGLVLSIITPKILKRILIEQKNLDNVTNYQKFPQPPKE